MAGKTITDCDEGPVAAQRFRDSLTAIFSLPADRAAEIRAAVKPAHRELPASQSTRRTSGGDRRSESGRDETARSPSRPAR